MFNKIASKTTPNTSVSSNIAIAPAANLGIQLKIHSHKVSEQKQDPSKMKLFKQWECIGNQHNPKGCSSNASANEKISNPSVKKFICEKKCPNVQLCQQCVNELSDAAVLPELIDHPLHPKHPLTRSFNLNDEWICNGKDYLGCVFNLPLMTGVKDIERYTCVECDYDLCISCVNFYLENPQIMTLYQITSSQHQHPMTRSFDDNCWYCNGFKNEVNCPNGMPEFLPNSKINRWRCDACDFDLCEQCLQDSMIDACPFNHPPDRESFQTVKL